MPAPPDLWDGLGSIGPEMNGLRPLLLTPWAGSDCLQGEGPLEGRGGLFMMAWSHLLIPAFTLAGVF